MKIEKMIHPADFPLELVATIAAKLLDGDSFYNAAERALKLLQQCQWAMVDAELSARAETAATIPFGKAIKTITGCPKAAAARRNYREFKQRLFTLPGATPEQWAQDAAESWFTEEERAGISADSIASYRALYLRAFPKRFSKKGLTGSNGSKGKTTLPKRANKRQKRANKSPKREN